MQLSTFSLHFMCILTYWNGLLISDAIWDCSSSTSRNKTTSQFRPVVLVPREVLFVRFYCTLICDILYVSIKQVESFIKTIVQKLHNPL